MHPRLLVLLFTGAMMQPMHVRLDNELNLPPTKRSRMIIHQLSVVLHSLEHGLLQSQLTLYSFQYAIVYNTL